MASINILVMRKLKLILKAVIHSTILWYRTNGFLLKFKHLVKQVYTFLELFPLPGSGYLFNTPVVWELNPWQIQPFVMYVYIFLHHLWHYKLILFLDYCLSFVHFAYHTFICFCFSIICLKSTFSFYNVKCKNRITAVKIYNRGTIYFWTLKLSIKVWIVASLICLSLKSKLLVDEKKMCRNVCVYSTLDASIVDFLKLIHFSYSQKSGINRNKVFHFV